MRKPKSTALYRTFLLDAWRLTWERKSLWIFGLFAAVISTGGVLDLTLSSLKRATDTSDLFVQALDSGFFGYSLLGSYIQRLSLLGGHTTASLLTAITLAAVLIFAVGVLSQAALAKSVGSKKHVDPHTLRSEAKHHFWQLTALALGVQFIIGALIALMSIAMFSLAINYTQTSVLLYVLLMAILIPLVVIVHLIYMFAVLDVIHGEVSIAAAIKRGWELFQKQWLASLEFGLLLFVIVFFTALALFFVLLALMVPYAMIFSTSLLSGSYVLFLISNVFYGLVLLVGGLLAGGMIVTFQYSAWYQFYKRALHKTHGKKHFSRILHIFRR